MEFKALPGLIPNGTNCILCVELSTSLSMARTMKQTRRSFLLQSTAATVAAVAAARHLARPVLAATSDTATERAATWIKQYDAQGIHRTGTTGDRQSANWLSAEVKTIGARLQSESFTFDRIDPLDCYVELGEKRIAGLPLFDATFTDATGNSGKLGAFGSDAEIGLLELPPNAEYTPNYEQMRRASRHHSLIVLTKGARPGLCLINGAWFKTPFGAPTLQVSSEHGEWLKQQAQTGATAKVVAQAKRIRTQAFNVVATIRGTNPKLAPLVVMTPRSGWWHSTSERGGGLVCWLETMRALIAAKPARPAIFVASSGHELGHLGLETFIEHRPQLVKQAHTWIHFGANIGAVGATNRIQAADDELESLAVAALTQTQIAINDKARRGAVPFGEAGNIHRGGGRYLSLLCPGSPLFHHPEDRWPHAVDVAVVARYAEAFASVAVKLAN